MTAMKYQVYKVIAHLQNKEAYTSDDLAFELGIAQRTAQRHLKELWVLDLVHICGWDRNYQSHVPVYQWGKKPDVARPKPLTPSEIGKRYRCRQAA